MNFYKYHQFLNYSFIDKINKLVLFGTKKGFYVFSLPSFKKILFNKIDGGSFKIKNKQLTNIFYVVKENDKKVLHIWDQSETRMIHSIRYNSEINDILISKNYIILIFEFNVSFFDIHLNFIKQLNDISYCKLTYFNIFHEVFYYINQNGNIVCLDLNSLKTTTIPYSQSSTQIFTVNLNNTLLAICNDKGYYIDLIDIQKKTIYKSLKRGITSSEIINLDFSDDNLFLIAQNSKGTLHLFDIQQVSIFNILNSSIYKLYPKNVISYTLFLENIVIMIDIAGNIHFISYKNKELIIQKSIRFLKNTNEPFDNRQCLIE